MSDRLKRVLLTVVATLLALGVCELGIRLAGLAPAPALLEADGYRLSDNPRLAYLPVPGSGRRNSLGFRDREHEREKAPGVRRLLVLGDSIADGFGEFPVEAPFPGWVETLMNRKGQRTEVINLGVSGYNTLQEVELYETLGAGYDPDLVILAYCLNDRQFVTSELIALLEEAERTGRPPSRRRSWLDGIHLVRYARHALRRGSAEHGLTAQLEPYRMHAVDSVADSFARLAAATRRNEHPVLVVVFPQFGDPRDFFEPKDIQRYGYSEEHDFVRALADEHGFDLLDLLDAFQRCDRAGDGPIAQDSYHPTALGHRCAADAIARHLTGDRAY